MTDPMELVERLSYSAAANRGLGRDGLVALLDEAAACIRELVDSREGVNEDLYQAVLVAYRRGATEWTRLNYPQWFNAIVAGREASQHADRGGV